MDVCAKDTVRLALGTVPDNVRALWLSHVQLFATLWTVAQQAPLAVRFSRQEYWSGLPFSPPGYHPDPGIKPESPVSPGLQADSLPAELSGKHAE